MAWCYVDATDAWINLKHINQRCQQMLLKTTFKLTSDEKLQASEA